LIIEAWFLGLFKYSGRKITNDEIGQMSCKEMFAWKQKLIGANRDID